MSDVNGMCPHNNQANYCVACATQKARMGYYGNPVPQMGLDINFSDLLSNAVKGVEGAAGAYIVGQASKDPAVQQQVQAGVGQKVGDFIVKYKMQLGISLAVGVVALIYFFGKSRNR